ncbi:MAG: LysM peptidoglycan-binding domain-containing protein [Verrucomicrobiota bacterium]|nr:LysM peptidoglycan-binding domain-containing protein [Limisphaera sp.]MDW8382325.1 LysM peptidoglycan-binding domain-containing protein [Verrucomicrobiota bacterium]
MSRLRYAGGAFMDVRTWLHLSLAANVLLAGGWLAIWLKRPSANPSVGLAPAVVTSQVPVARTNYIPRRQFFHWSEIESPDYAIYVANLRAIGCPEQTIRDIIVADVNALFARRRALEIWTPLQEWWRAEPDPDKLAEAQAKLAALETERRALLTRLLGPQWESADQVSLPRPAQPGLALDGPLLGTLPQEIKERIQDLHRQYQERLLALQQRAAAEHREISPAEQLRLQQQWEQELARLLTPAQWEEFLLRHSPTARALRQELADLRWLELTPDQFRAWFHARRRYEQGLVTLAESGGPATALQLEQLQRSYEQALQVALGSQSYQVYKRLQDPEYREALAEARQTGRPELTDIFYAIRQALAEEQARLQTNSSLTTLQREIELRRLELEALKARAEVLGQSPQEPAPSRPAMRVHTYQAGETILSLAVDYDVPLSAILRANPGLDFHRLKPGDTILIPAPTP